MTAFSYIKFIAILLLAMPLCVRAVDTPENFGDFLTIISDIIALLIPFILILTFLTIVWGVIKAWIMGGGESEQIEVGKKIVTVGVVALVAMTAIWGILKILQASFFGITG